jgi:SAM-dependent methyltransferase
VTYVAAAPYTKSAPLYDKLVGDSGFSHLRRAFEQTCRRHDIGFSSLADLGCGTGRFLAYVNATRPEVRLVGIDLSPEMLKLARRRLGDRASLSLQDARNFELPSPVDVVTCRFNTLNCILRISDLTRAFSSCARNLSVRGHLIFDILTNAAFVALPRIVRQRIRVGDVSATWRIVTRADGAGSVVHMRTCTGGTDGARECWREVHVQRWWPLSLVAELLARTGFDWLGAYRPYDSAPFTSTDRWVQIVARRSN